MNGDLADGDRMMLGDELEDFHFGAADVGLGTIHSSELRNLNGIDDNCRQDCTHDNCRQWEFILTQRHQDTKKMVIGEIGVDEWLGN